MSEKISVLWWSAVPGERAGGRWDGQGVRQQLVPLTYSPPSKRGVVIVPAGVHANKVDVVNEVMTEFDTVTLILTADEQSIFPVHQLKHDNLVVWRQTPRPDLETPEFM